MEYQSKELAARWAISGETLRQWSIEVRRHLSDGATPAPGQHRRYTFEDVEVLQLVADMRGKNKSWPDIHTALDEGERGVPEVDPAALIPLEGQRQLSVLYNTIETLRADKDALESELRAAQEAGGQKDALNNLLMRQLEAAQQEIKTLNREIGRLETRINPPKE